jgi:hypothetical protein
MNLPFTRDQFLDVFATYHTGLWPFVLALSIGTVVTVLGLFRDPQSSGRPVTALLVVQWIWAGLAYHAAFFARINPAAPLFAAVFLAEGALLAWHGLLRGRLHWSSTRYHDTDDWVAARCRSADAASARADSDRMGRSWRSGKHFY